MIIISTARGTRAVTQAQCQAGCGSRRRVGRSRGRRAGASARLRLPGQTRPVSSLSGTPPPPGRPGADRATTARLQADSERIGNASESESVRHGSQAHQNISENDLSWAP